MADDEEIGRLRIENQILTQENAQRGRDIAAILGNLKKQIADLHIELARSKAALRLVISDLRAERGRYERR